MPRIDLVKKIPISASGRARQFEVIEKKDRPALGGGIVTFRQDVRNAVGNRVMIYEILRLIADDRHADTGRQRDRSERFGYA